MTTIGMRINYDGSLTRDGGAFYRRRHLSGRFQLELERLPVGLVEKGVRLVGTPIAPDIVAVDGVAPA